VVDIDLVVLVEPAVAQNLRGGRADEGSAEAIAEIVRAAGRTLTPLHPQAANASMPQDMLASFVITAPASPELDKLAERLRSVPGVEAAYVKPRDEPP
jgi:hypothetical protein